MCEYIVQLPAVCVFVDEKQQNREMRNTENIFLINLCEDAILSSVFKNLEEGTFLENEFQTEWEVCKDFNTSVVWYKQR